MTITDSPQIEKNGDAITQEQPLDHFIESAYRRYAILTILDRALPDVRDGLKPVQRRILYAMHDMGIRQNTPHRKSVRVVGEVLGKYHPHGDTSVYDAMVRMAQDFVMRSPLIDGQGNFGSIDGDSAAAMRYTEARLSSIGEAMLKDIESNTVNWNANFDNSLNEPEVLPTRLPNLLINGSSGIAVGMSTNILPHNLGEVCDAVIYLTQNWQKIEKITVDDLLKIIPGPDFPTGGLLYRYRVNGDEENTDVIRQAYETGNATMVCQAKADIREIGGGKSEIIVTELPYQVQKSTVLERIASHKEKFPGITDVRDESDYNGMRIVFEVARGTDPQDVLDRLLTHTQMRSSLSHNALALVQKTNGVTRSVPQYLTLRSMLSEFILHRLNVIVRRSQFELEKIEARLHIVTGLLKALSMIDEVVEIIRRSQTTETARMNLMKKLDLSQVQAQAILDMPLRRLASLERKKLEDEQKNLATRIKELKAILASEPLRLKIISEEIADIKEQFSNPRRTIIIDSEEGHQAQVTVADLVQPTQNQIVVVTQNNLFRTDAGNYRDSTTTGKTTSRAVDIPLLKTTAEPTDILMLVSNQGRLWQANIGRLPIKTTYPEIGLKKNERIVGCGTVSALSENHFLTLITTNGYIKRIKSIDCLNGRSEASWVTIIGLDNDRDEVLFAGITTEISHAMICTRGSQNIDPRVLRFETSGINPQATPSARGVTAIKMLDDPLVSAALFDPDAANLSSVFLTKNGHIKRVGMDEFPLQGRGGQGVLCWKPSQASGLISGFSVIPEKCSVNIFSSKGKRLRILPEDIFSSSRAGKGESLVTKYGENSVLFPADEIAGLSVS